MTRSARFFSSGHKLSRLPDFRHNLPRPVHIALGVHGVGHERGRMTEQNLCGFQPVLTTHVGRVVVAELVGMPMGDADRFARALDGAAAAVRRAAVGGLSLRDLAAIVAGAAGT